MQERMRSYFFSLSLFLFARAHERVGGGVGTKECRVIIHYAW